MTVTPFELSQAVVDRYPKILITPTEQRGYAKFTCKLDDQPCLRAVGLKKIGNIVTEINISGFNHTPGCLPGERCCTR